MTFPKEQMDVDDDNDSDSSCPEGIRAWAVEFLYQQLNRTLVDDPLSRCGPALLAALFSRPKEVLREAHRLLYSKRPDEVDASWLRLFEEASLLVVLALLDSPPPSEDDDALKTWLADIVAILDRAIIIAGALDRRQVINHLLRILDPIAQQCNNNTKPQLYEIVPPPPFVTSRPTACSKVSFTDAAFADFLIANSHSPRPIILPGVMKDWPALHLWQDVNYLRHRTMAGLRLVPIEIGSSYTSPDWTQKLVTFSHFADTYLGPFQNRPSSHQAEANEEDQEVAYLAQHDLLTHIPSLLSDLSVPSLCSVSPPPPNGPALQTPGLSSSLPHAGQPPRMNAWLGPSGTKTPLHTDPWHNLFCQVVGYKYVRLYPPEARERLYPRASDGNGVDGSNTSSVDVKFLRPPVWLGEDKSDEWRQERRKQVDAFPKAEGEQGYVEAVLGPGEAMYVPLGWWHYVESGTTSFSVSFWWI